MKNRKSSRSCCMAGMFWTLLLLAADQITKALACMYLKNTSGISLISGVFELYYVENRSAAFGMLTNRQLLFVVIAVIMIALSAFVYSRLPMEKHYDLLRAVCVLIAAGAGGNLIDRLARGYVVDFLYFSLIDFPVFNIADCCVCIGAALAVILLFTVYKTEEFAFLKLRR
ncbi:MAG: signal peptidase II [Lachnospiraceae bacterium]|nr:signal peptidase II [Lachnospiraceae bacterium]